MSKRLSIEKVWFEANRIFVSVNDGRVLDRPLEAFPALLEASEQQRLNYEISQFGDALRWKELDEDIHISSFEQNVEPDSDNEVGRLFKKLPWLNVSEIAKEMGINKSLLAKYIYGIKTPSSARMQQIKNTIRMLGRRMEAV